MNAASKSIKTIILWVLGTGATEFAGFESHSLFITTSFFNSVFVKFVWRIILSLPIQQYLLITFYLYNVQQILQKGLCNKHSSGLVSTY